MPALKLTWNNVLAAAVGAAVGADGGAVVGGAVGAGVGRLYDNSQPSSLDEHG